EDDAHGLHVWRADASLALRGVGAAPYLDIEQIVIAARQSGCDAIHPGYGFLSENAGFAARCAVEGITFVGPAAPTLEILGDKTKARHVAEASHVPVLKGSAGSVSAEEAAAFFDALGDGAAMVIKAVAGGGGRGMRVVRRRDQVETAFAHCRSEA